MTLSGYRCPANPEHGQLLLLNMHSERNMHCPHSDHVRTQPYTQTMFTIYEVDSNYKMELVRAVKTARTKARARKHRV